MMTQDKISKFRRCIDRVRTMLEQRPEAILPDERGLLLTWADELEAELDAEEVEQS